MNSRTLFVIVTLFINSVLVAQWVQTNGPNGGNVSSLLQKDSILFAGVLDSGMYRSSDRGQSWVSINNGLTNERILSIASSENNLYVGTDAGGGFFTSTNNGDNWTSTKLYGTSVFSFLFSRPNIFIGTNAGVYNTIDKGKSWVVSLKNDSIYALSILDGKIFAGTDHGIFMSIDNGSNWIQQTGTSTHTFCISGTNFMAGTSIGLMLSEDSGSTWNRTVSGDMNSILSLVVSGGKLLAGMNRGAYGSIDTGKTWHEAIFGFPQYINAYNIFYSLIFFHNQFYAGTNRGIFLSSDTLFNWISIGFPNQSINVLTTVGKDLFAGSWGESVFNSSDRGQNWISVDSNLNATEISALIGFGNNIFVGTYNQVFTSTNTGIFWSSISYMPDVSSFFTYQGEIFVGADAVQHSLDSGKTWINDNYKYISNGISYDNKVTALGVKDDVIYACTYNGEVFRSNIGSNTWSPITSGLRKGWIYALIIYNNYMLIGTDNGVYRTSDSGMSWYLVNALGPFTSLIFSGTNLFAGSRTSGIFRSSDNGDSWISLNTGLLNTSILSLAISDSNLYAGTMGSSVWRRPLSEMIPDAVQSSNQPSQFHLNQNYPNPFSGTTTIRFDIPERTPISLKVYDITGREVAVLASEMMDAGSETRTFNAEGLPSGTYVCQLKAGGYREARTLQILR